MVVIGKLITYRIFGITYIYNIIFRIKVIILSESSKLSRKQHWRQRAKKLKSEVLVLYFAGRDPRVPWYTKLFILLVVGYAFSPIDLIPDFVPIFGYFDDLVLIPLGVTLVIKMIPPNVINDARVKAQELKAKPKKWVTAGVIIVLWFFILIMVVIFIYKEINPEPLISSLLWFDSQTHIFK